MLILGANEGFGLSRPSLLPPLSAYTLEKQLENSTANEYLLVFTGITNR